MKLFYYDLDTTGVNHWQHGIHQLAGMIEIDGEVKDTFDFRMRPDRRCKIDDEALKIGGISLQDMEAYPDHTKQYASILNLLGKYVNKFDKTDKFHLVGYNNASFDNNFFRALFKQNNDNYFGSWFWSSAIDVMVLAAQELMYKRHQMENFKLMTVAAEFGINIDEKRLHEGGYDIELTRCIYHKICSKL